MLLPIINRNVYWYLITHIYMTWFLNAFCRRPKDHQLKMFCIIHFWQKHQFPTIKELIHKWRIRLISSLKKMMMDILRKLTFNIQISIRFLSHKINSLNNEILIKDLGTKSLEWVIWCNLLITTANYNSHSM